MILIIILLINYQLVISKNVLYEANFFQVFISLMIFVTILPINYQFIVSKNVWNDIIMHGR